MSTSHPISLVLCEPHTPIFSHWLNVSLFSLTITEYPRLGHLSRYVHLGSQGSASWEVQGQEAVSGEYLMLLHNEAASRGKREHRCERKRNQTKHSGSQPMGYSLFGRLLFLKAFTL